MKVIGITGGIGSGKSMVSIFLEINGIPVYNTDIAAKRLSDFSLEIREKLTARFGSSVYEYDLLNRKMLASLIFGNPENMLFVNSVIHPAVKEDFLDWKENHAGKAWTGIESAVLFETDYRFEQLADFTINVSAPLETRIERVKKRDCLSREEVLSRINSQMPDEARNRLVDYILVNDDVQALTPQVENLLKRLKFQEFV